MFSQGKIQKDLKETEKTKRADGDENRHIRLFFINHAQLECLINPTHRRYFETSHDGGENILELFNQDSMNFL